MELGIGGLGLATEIGVGASAIVYRARQLDLDREVAVKVLSVTDEAFVRRFNREAKTLGKLSRNPGIVTVYDTGVNAAGQPYLILELCTGSLLEELRGNGRFEPYAACAALAQVADAVNDAHENGVIHRDLKPGNVLISQSGRYMVADFGISTVTGATMGQTNSVGFTAGYVAPETLSDERAGTASDVYALGATLFHMLAGRVAFIDGAQNGNLLALAQRVIKDPVPDLRPEGVPDEICRIVEGAMAKRPEDRPTAAQLRDQLLAVEGAGRTEAGVGAAGAAAAMAAPLAPPAPIASADSTIAAEPGAIPAPNPGGDQTAVGDGPPGPTTSLFDAASSAPAAGSGLGPAPGGQRPILGAEADREPAASYDQPPPVAQTGRHPIYSPDRGRLLPLLIGAAIGVILLIGVGALLVIQNSGDDDLDAGSSLETEAETPTSLEQDGSGSTTPGDGGDVGNLEDAKNETTTTETTLTSVVQVAVPDVVGDSAAQASAQLEAAGFVVSRVEESGTTAPVGQVIRQSPTASSQRDEGSIVTIFVAVADPIEKVEVPPVVGQTAAAATTALTDAGLKVTVTDEPSATVADGEVIRATPSGGQEVDLGSTVELIVSSGPAADCSDTTGTTVSEARALLEGAGLTVAVTREPSETVPVEGVIGCTLSDGTASLVVSSGSVCTGLVGTDLSEAVTALEAAGFTVTTTAEAGAGDPDTVRTCTVTGESAITLTFAEPPLDCDDQVGRRVGQARAALTAAGVTDITVERAASNTVAEDRVISCSGSGTSATLVVSSGPEQVAVPDVSGRSVLAATTAIEDAGLDVDGQDEVDSDEPAGTVVGTNPAAGTEVDPGTDITLLVSNGEGS